jgi:predicted metalloprotease
VWAKGAVATGFITDLSSADIKDGLDAAAAVGDDRIQQAAQGRVDPESFTHGTAEQRQRWFQRGFDGGARTSCDTFGTNDL